MSTDMLKSFWGSTALLAVLTFLAPLNFQVTEGFRTEKLALFSFEPLAYAMQFFSRQPYLRSAQVSRLDTAVPISSVKLRQPHSTADVLRSGIKSMIATDLVEFADPRTISYASLISGDASLAVSVDFAKSMGVRVTVLDVGGRPSAKMKAQTDSLHHSADRATHLGHADLALFFGSSTARPI